ncbi:3-phosphoshikimate 1-carboxyvinyltransferase [Candidatus Micrarchaeota archaeon]|nr:3-phosphoshikimate 1-carboxyvinyltransferase [Candidatus Micrarchaeota archaeon]
MSELSLIIRKSALVAEAVVVPSSKSYTHRAIIAAALCKGKTIVKNPLISADILATMDALRKFGVKFTHNSDSIEVDGSNNLLFSNDQSKNPIVIDCNESGTTLRLLTSIVALLDQPIILTGKKGLLKRPTNDIVTALSEIGVKISDQEGHGPVKSNGGLRNSAKSKIKISGNKSSQFISGLLFALPLAKKDSELEITTEVESLPYIKMTLEVLAQFGIKVDVSADYKKYIISGNQHYRSTQTYEVEGDYSSAAFLLAAGVLAGPQITLSGLNPKSTQGDSAIIQMIKSMGGRIEINENKNEIIAHKSGLSATKIDVKDNPDLVPILVILATQAKGTTKIINAGRLRIKESDRLAAITQELQKMGAKIVENKDSLEIIGPTKLHGAIIDPHNDHRIAMACTIAGLIAEGETKIQNPEVVAKSYPDFFFHMRKLGANVLSETGSIGEKFKITVYGGSHEKVIGIKISGLAKETEISIEEIKKDLDKRRPFGNLTTPRREEDELKVVKGLENGKVTDEEEIVFEIENKDVNSKPYEMMRFTPRPNHGDYTTAVKYGGVFDFRGGGFLSARMTTCTVIAGSIAKQILAKEGIAMAAYVKQIGETKMEKMPSIEEAKQKTYESEVRCPDIDLGKEMKKEIEKARAQNDSLGGIIECQVIGLPVGVGEPIFNAVDSVLSHYLFSIPAVKGVEFGSGFSASSKKGSENNDEFMMGADSEGSQKIITKTNNSGGIQGGITNGMPLVARIAIKPTSSIAKEQNTVNMKELGSAKISVLGRHDPCVAIRAPIIMETMIAIAILDLMLRR